MKAVVVKGRMDYSVVADAANPTAAPGRAVLSISYASLCYRDLLELMGYYPRMRYPVVLGHEAVGVVEESMDPRYRPGDRVVPMLYEPDGTCDMCLRGEEVYCRSRRSYGEDVDGFFAERAAVAANALVKVPTWVNDELAVLVPCVIAMIYKGLRRASLSQGETVLVTGAGGGVGIHAVQLAKAMGARVIGVTSREDKAGAVAKYADEVVIGSKFGDEVKKRAGEVDVVVENVGTPTLGESLRSLRMGGRLVLIGNVKPDEAYELRLGYAIMKDIAVIGNVAANRGDIWRTFELMRVKTIEPIVTKYSLEEFEAALDQLRRGDKVGKILLKP
ncbi:alcohol dehydrogenase [Thermocladium modestius]|uniref:Alcohol dehydrogenase n=1 Tax=Thermocladium modestius TaxID=62609 RepID=A0A830GU88_9CREN|nr:acryloyl-coenzyme A reductase [Thermocladium modestius]GGP19629.1 alcohol dehydrogenase [Thermocladium modestius]